MSTGSNGFQRLVTIPGKLILDEMLKQLGFPLAQYECKIYEDHKIYVTVIFQTSNLSCHGSLAPMRISGVRSMDVAMAEHTAATATIRYIEAAANTVIKDLNYRPLKQTEEENMHLKSQRTDVKGQLKKAMIKNKRLARGWFYSVRSMFSFSAQFYNVAVVNNFAGQEIISDDMKAALANIYGAALRLKSKSAQLESKLEEVRHS